MPDPLGQGRESVRVPVDGVHLGARAREGPRDARPDAARCSGDEGGAPGQVDGFVDRQGTALEAVRGVVACVGAGVGHAGRLRRPVRATGVVTEHKTPDLMWTALTIVVGSPRRVA